MKPWWHGVLDKESAYHLDKQLEEKQKDKDVWKGILLFIAILITGILLSYGCMRPDCPSGYFLECTGSQGHYVGDGDIDCQCFPIN